jgi:hypothetical protein
MASTIISGIFSFVVIWDFPSNGQFVSAYRQDHVGSQPTKITMAGPNKYRHSNTEPILPVKPIPLFAGGVSEVLLVGP